MLHYDANGSESGSTLHTAFFCALPLDEATCTETATGVRFLIVGNPAIGLLAATRPSANLAAKEAAQDSQSRSARSKRIEEDHVNGAVHELCIN